MKKTKNLIVAVICFIVLLAVIQVTVSNSFTTDGIQLSKTQEKIATLKKENTLLREQLYTKSSYTNIASAAATLGFIESRSSIFLDAPLPIAIKQ